MRQELDSLQDHAVELSRVVLVARRQNRDRRFRDRASVFARDDFGHRLLVRERRRMQQRLAHAVTNRGVQPLSKWQKNIADLRLDLLLAGEGGGSGARHHS